MSLPQLDSRLVYYLILYVFVFMLRFFRLYPQMKNEFRKVSWKHVAFGSLDIVYTSAGVVALLILNERQWVEALFAGWALLLVASTLLDFQGEQFSDNARLGGHLLVASCVVVGTVATFQSIVPATAEPGTPTAPQPIEYRVAISYVDLTLDQHLGKDRLGDRRFVFVTSVKALSARDADDAATNEFWNEGNKNVVPYDPKRRKNNYTLSIVGNPVVEPAGLR